MNEEGYIKLCRTEDLKENQGKRFIVNETEIALFKTGNEIYALSNICPHQHTALIYDGFIEDDCVVCPVHGWKFNLKTGRQPAGQTGLKTFPLKIIDNEIFVKVVKNEFRW